VTDRETDRYHKNGIFICVEWAARHFGLGWHQSIHFWRRYARKNDFYIFVPSGLLWPQICSPS